MSLKNQSSNYIFRVYADDNEPYEFNEYTIGYYSQLNYALKKQYRVQMQYNFSNVGDYYDMNVSIEYIKIIQ